MGLVCVIFYVLVSYLEKFVGMFWREREWCCLSGKRGFMIMVVGYGGYDKRLVCNLCELW